MSKIITIDDEPLARSIVKEYLQKYIENNKYPEYEIMINGLNRILRINTEDTYIHDYYMNLIDNYTKLRHTQCEKIYNEIMDDKKTKFTGEILNEMGGIELMRECFYIMIMIFKDNDARSIFKALLYCD